jgi:two-component system invasion response regulator UvrY
MLKILLVDDHAIVRAGVRDIIATAFNDVVISEASRGREALHLAQNERWDAVVLDITMPDLSGVETLKRLKSHKPRLPVLMLSMHSNPAYIQWSLAAGADGYVSKEHAPEELVQALQAVLAGGTYVSGSMSEAGRTRA